MEEKLSKVQYRFTLLCLKYLPLLIAICQFVLIVLNFISPKFIIFGTFCYIPFLSGLLILLFSKLFHFCIWHRLPIYYCWTNQIITWCDNIIGIPISSHWIFCVYLSIVIIFVLLGMYFKNKYNESNRIIKRGSD